MIYRKATIIDLPSIVSMLADDELGKTRENHVIPLPQEYINAFNNILQDNNQELIVVSENNQIIGTMQISYLQYITYKGGIRAQIEAVRIIRDKRGTGLGKKMIEWAINRAKEKKAHLLQLTTDKKRPEAISFYKNLGFVDTHLGMKLHLENNNQ